MRVGEPVSHYRIVEKIGGDGYAVTATDRFGRTATFSPFINRVSQLATSNHRNHVRGSYRCDS